MMDDTKDQDGRLSAADAAATALAPASQVEPASGLEQSRSSHGAGWRWERLGEAGASYILVNSDGLPMLYPGIHEGGRLALFARDGDGRLRELSPHTKFARLIAAAPDLYEALFAILNSTQTSIPSLKMTKQALAALSLARGES